MDFSGLAQEAARKAGGILQDWAGRFTAREKSRANLVTEADFASQEAIFEMIRGECPDHAFLGEEELNQETESDYRWVIDPLDGTSNYVHGFPYYAVSIGLEYRGELILGVILDPTRDEMFVAEKGKGATLNGQPIQTTPTGELAQAMTVASLPVAVKQNDPAIERFFRVMPHVQTVQRTGSAALNLAYVAAGRMEAFWSSSLKPWDMAAGVVIVREAGGKVSRMNGQPFELALPDLLSSNGTKIHQELQSLLT